MLSDIEAGLINCVIVKDLSRLGRNVIDTGYYIERYFPMQKVRFIVVNDRYDSSSPDNAHDGIIIPLRNMINEAYAMDIARKIKAQQRQAMKDGKYVPNLSFPHSSTLVREQLRGESDKVLSEIMGNTPATFLQKYAHIHGDRKQQSLDAFENIIFKTGNEN